MDVQQNKIKKIFKIRIVLPNIKIFTDVTGRKIRNLELNEATKSSKTKTRFNKAGL